jgi:hypothetical protein
MEKAREMMEKINESVKEKRMLIGEDFNARTGKVVLSL